MLETKIIDYLTDALDVPVYMEKPADPPAQYAIVMKTGTSHVNHIDSAMIVIQSIAETLYEAAQLNENVISAMLSIVELPSFSRCILNSDYEFTNTATKERRYQAVFDLIYY